MRRGRRLEYLGYVAISLAMWGVPLLNRLHVESSAVLAAGAFFLAGVSAISALSVRGDPAGPLSGVRVRRAVSGSLAVLLVPLVLMLVPMLWAPNCGWRAGVGFFALFVPPSAVLGVAVAAVLTRAGFRRPLRWLVATGLGLILVGVVYDLGFHPQFYTYNHVFGGVLGPIYDEQLTVRPGLFVFRVLTLAWAFAGLAWATGRGRLAGGLLILVCAVYAFSGRLGINTTYADLERALPASFAKGPIRLHFDPSRTDTTEARQMLGLAAFEYARISELLETSVDEPVEVYVYPDSWTRAELTGARQTSVAPVWLARPQVHVESSSFEAIFPHELVHAVSREFGLPVIRASPAVGLVEGLAVALEPPDG
ncbi:MAG: hypothetical protein HKN29_14160, partial [Rhodothermales bacterium]|nr:hypothetical protein [Rhodothermales bacterium]